MDISVQLQGVIALVVAVAALLVLEYGLTRASAKRNRRVETPRKKEPKP